MTVEGLEDETTVEGVEVLEALRGSTVEGVEVLEDSRGMTMGRAWRYWKL